MNALVSRARDRWSWVVSVVVVGAVFAITSPLLPSYAQNPLPVPPPSVGAAVDGTYFGPNPSQSLADAAEFQVGPVQLLRSGTVSEDGLSITIPLYEGTNRNGDSVWYILTDSSDKANANALGLNFSAKLAYASTGSAARRAILQTDATLQFDKGTVDFSPERSVTPGEAPNLFPPAAAQPGSVGDADYTPLVRIVNQPGTPVYNAPVVAYGVGADQINFCDGNVDHGLVHDRVTAICPSADSNGTGTVTIALTPIFSFGKPAVYMSTEATDPVVAALDMATLAPAMADLPVGRDDSAFSAVERLFPIANGPTGADNPQRQGLNSAIADEGPPLNVIGGIPTVATDYSPVWDLNLAVWTQEAIDRGYRARIIDEFQLLGLVEDGWITGPDGAAFGSTGIIVNCPIVMRFL